MSFLHHKLLKSFFNFPTKRHWKVPSKLEDIKKGLNSLIEEITRLKIKSIAVPALGSGLGGLDWKEVKPIIIDAFSKIPEVNVLLFEPNFKPALDSIAVNTKKPKITLTKALLIKLLQAYQALGYPFSLLEIQKLMYFGDVALGGELQLQFTKKQYGPYTNKVNFVLQSMESHYTWGYGDGNQRASIQLLEGAIVEANTFFQNNDQYLEKIKAIENLIDGFETPFGMELLATVHWVAFKESAQNFLNQDIVLKVQNWNDRKKKLFEPNHINIALERLRQEKWI